VKTRGPLDALFRDGADRYAITNHKREPQDFVRKAIRIEIAKGTTLQPLYAIARQILRRNGCVECNFTEVGTDRSW
jgi:hypothetical protein